MASSAPLYAFLEFLLPVHSTIIFPKHWLLSNMITVETMNMDERGINVIGMTVINPQKEIALAWYRAYNLVPIDQHELSKPQLE